MEVKDQLKTVLHQIINGEQEKATETLHNYFVDKTKQIQSGPAQVEDAPEIEQND